MALIYSLGTSLRSPEDFIDLLRHYQIEMVVDIRRFASSRLDHFKKEALMNLLQANSIGYFYLGWELGGYRKGGYEAYTTSDGFSLGLKKLEEIAEHQLTTFMCAELLPWRCHRRFIGRSLSEKGWQVVHIIDEKRTWQPSPSS